MKNLVEKTKTNFPMPALLISCQADSKLDIIAISWITMISQSPPSLLVSFLKTRYSLELIKKSMRFGVNVPSAKDMDKLNYCGIHSGRDKDKFKEMQFSPFYSKYDPLTPMIKECPLNVLCEVVSLIEYEDRFLVIGKISEVYSDEEAMTAKKQISQESIQPFVYWMSGGEYWNIGTLLGSVKDGKL